MNISGPAAVAKPEMLFYAPGDLTVTVYPPLLVFFVFFFSKFVMNNFMTKIKGFSKGSRVCQSKAVTRHKRRK